MTAFVVQGHINEQVDAPHLLKLLGFGEVAHVVDDFDPVVEAVLWSEFLNDRKREYYEKHKAVEKCRWCEWLLEYFWPSGCPAWW